MQSESHKPLTGLSELRGVESRGWRVEGALEQMVQQRGDRIDREAEEKWRRGTRWAKTIATYPEQGSFHFHFRF